MNSAIHPSKLGPSQYRRAVNISNRGGVISPRPGFVQVSALPDGLLQGSALFLVTGSDGTQRQFWVVCISGVIYQRLFGSDTTLWTALTGTKLSPTATRVSFCRADRFVDATGTVPALLATPQSCLLISDGATQPQAWVPALSQTALQPVQNMPLASVLALAGSRVWAAVGNRVAAGDFGDPLSWKERTEAGPTSGDFFFETAVTALFPTPSPYQNAASLAVWTANDSEILRADIKDREQWGSQGFRLPLAAGVGCVDSLSVVRHGGTLWWVSPSGLVSADRAASAYLTAVIKARDVEMSAWKPLLLENAGACSTSWDGRLLVSRRLGDNSVATEVLDSSISDVESGSSAPCWSSYWTGPNLGSWHTVGTRLFCFSSDSAPTYGTRNRLWEVVSGVGDRSLRPNGSGGFQVRSFPVKWSFETSYFLRGKELMRLKCVDCDFEDVSEGFKTEVFVSGPFSTKASLGSSVCAKASGGWRFTTSDTARNEEVPDDRGSTPGVDKTFSLTVTGIGSATLVSLTASVAPFPESSTTLPLDSSGSPVHPAFELPPHNPVTANA
jgi:hypothetical protein